MRQGQSIQTAHKTTRVSKIEEHKRICGRDSFKIFPFLQMQSNDTNLRRDYETNFQTQYKTKLNQLGQIKVMTQSL